MIIATVDVETSTGGDLPDPSNDEICEFGMVVAEYESRTIITQVSKLYSVKNWNERSAAIHKIPKELCDMYGHAVDELPKLSEIINLNAIDYVIAHNAPYDHGAIKNCWPDLTNKNWLCSKEDFAHDSVNVTSKKLGHIAADYGISTGGAHRALADCLMVMEMAFRNDIKKAWEKKNERKFDIIAKGSYQRDIPEKFKERKWRWNGDNKIWHKENVSASDFKEEVSFVKSIGFEIEWEEKFPAY